MSVYREHQLSQRGNGIDNDGNAAPQEWTEIRQWTKVTDAINATAFRYIVVLQWATFSVFLTNVLGIVVFFVSAHQNHD